MHAMPAIATAETLSAASALAGIGRRLKEIVQLNGLAEALAIQQCRDSEALVEFRATTESIWTAIVDEAEPALAAAIEAERDLTDRGEITDAEHVAQERAMDRWRSVA